MIGHRDYKEDTVLWEKATNAAGAVRSGKAPLAKAGQKKEEEKKEKGKT